ncbi:MAG: DUF6361 family protein [Clostridiales bacterium]|nr:DUF6361 family protein [Clostridiales bacterium]
MELGWIDFSKKDRQRVLDVMSLLHEQGAVDELGIGIVRDAFANVFFPGTSTVQTRAKYFLIVPYILKDAVDGRYGRDVNRILRCIDEDEKTCGIRFLENNPDEDGVIGKRVLPNGWVARKPSDIYWNGIRAYGIFTDDTLSIREYVALSMKLKNDKLRLAAGNRGDDVADADRDDKDAGDFRMFRFWNIPVWSQDWRENLQMDLTREEALFLKSQIIRNTEPSLLSYILKNHVDMEPYGDFEVLTEALSSQLDEHTAYLMRLASDFNNLVYMARVRYNVILSDGENEEAIREWKYLSADSGKYASVDLKAVFEELQIKNTKTYAFLAELQGCFYTGRMEDADACIRKREIQLKGVARAKLNRSEDFNPQDWVGGRKLDYRFSNAKRIIQDIYAGEACGYV